MSDLTIILQKIDAGDPQAHSQLLPVVYDKLRKLAAAKLAHEKPGQTLEATALVHEAYLRLLGSDLRAELRTASGFGHSQSGPAEAIGTYNSRGHFFAAAAEAMRRILVEQARRKNRVRHGGGLRRVEFDSQVERSEGSRTDLLALDEALLQLEREEPSAAAVVKLRYFAGLTIEEAAGALKISVRTANRHWAYARAWLYQRLN
jgi:RNA polymerase sigma factor (sigma-70 family)